MIESCNEYISLARVPKSLPPVNGQRLNRATPFRWASRGVCYGGGHIVLKTIMLGGQRVTTRAWLDEFVQATTAARTTATTPAAIRSSVQRDREADAAIERLRGMGVDC